MVLAFDLLTVVGQVATDELLDGPDHSDETQK
jgi:hypothetical protein